MISFLNVVSENGIVLVCFVIFAFLGLIKELSEWQDWIKKKLESWRLKENGIEQDKRTVEERLTSLEKHNEKQDKKIDSLCQKNDSMDSKVDWLIDVFKKFKEDNDKREFEKRIERTRWKIMQCATAISNHEKIPEDQIRTIFKLYKDYEDELKEHGMSNGECEISMDIIREYTRDMIIDGTFTRNENET